MSYNLRLYQQAPVDAAFNWVKYKSGVHGFVVAPGGSGKSVMIAKLAERVWDGLQRRVVILARNERLLRQNMDKLTLDHQMIAGVYCAGLGAKDVDKPITIASIQSIYTLGELFKGAVLLCDEAHNLPNSTDDDTQYWRFINAAEAQVIGFTATPYRTQGGKIAWGEEIAAVPIAPLFASGYLCKPVNKAPIVPNLDGVAIKMGEYVSSQLEEVFTDPNLLHRTIEVLLRYSKAEPRRNCVVLFTQSIKHSQLLMASMIENMVCDASEVICVDGDTDKGELNDDILVNWANPEHPLRYVINCQLLKEGIDVPEIDCVVVLRSTVSKTLWEQMLYRGTRPVSGKQDFLALDMGGNFLRHGGLGTPYGGGVSKRESKPQNMGKICPRCETHTGEINCKQCPDCGFEFPEMEKRTVAHDSEPYTGSEVSAYYAGGADKTAWYEVTGVDYMPHKSKTKGTLSLRVRYFTDYQDFNEWLSPFSDSAWARNRFHQYFINGGRDLGGDAAVKLLLTRHNSEEVMAMIVGEAKHLKAPSEIKVDFSKNAKYGDVKGVRYAGGGCYTKGIGVILEELDDVIQF